ncbi:hypothetical protein C8J57DRAFT_485038 [Mycena rebaudengoi]|nr:hypothetical protein C8J57DRAFT_485038 [Mycena rebaudengoi]
MPARGSSRLGARLQRAGSILAAQRGIALSQCHVVHSLSLDNDLHHAHGPRIPTAGTPFMRRPRTHSPLGTAHNRSEHGIRPPHPLSRLIPLRSRDAPPHPHRITSMLAVRPPSHHIAASPVHPGAAAGDEHEWRMRSAVTEGSAGRRVEVGKDRRGATGAGWLRVGFQRKRSRGTGTDVDVEIVGNERECGEQTAVCERMS